MVAHVFNVFLFRIIIFFAFVFPLINMKWSSLSLLTSLNSTIKLLVSMFACFFSFTFWEYLFPFFYPMVVSIIDNEVFLWVAPINMVTVFLSKPSVCKLWRDIEFININSYYWKLCINSCCLVDFIVFSSANPTGMCFHNWLRCFWINCPGIVRLFPVTSCVSLSFFNTKVLVLHSL